MGWSGTALLPDQVTKSFPSACVRHSRRATPCTATRSSVSPKVCWSSVRRWRGSPSLIVHATAVSTEAVRPAGVTTGATPTAAAGPAVTTEVAEIADAEMTVADDRTVVALDATTGADRAAMTGAAATVAAMTVAATTGVVMTAGGEAKTMEAAAPTAIAQSGVSARLKATVGAETASPRRRGMCRHSRQRQTSLKRWPNCWAKVRKIVMSSIPVALADTIVEPEVTSVPVLDDGDHDRFSHYAKKADITKAHVEGTPIRALCGKIWVPSRDPSKYPICPDCKAIFELIKSAKDQ